MQNSVQKGNILIILGVVIALLAGFIIYNNKSNSKYQPPSTSQQTATNNAEQTRTYQSKNLKFTITIPTNTQIQEKNTYLDVVINGSVIDVVRNGTNADSLNIYLKDYDTKKNVQISDNNNLTINGYEANSRIETNIGSGIKQKIYYIYTDNWVYAISTNSESLYNDLDQIAKSFRYTGE